MPGDHDTVPEPGSPEAHWSNPDPENQPSRDLVAGLRRLVTEARDRLGAAATPAVVAAELKARGLEVDEPEVAKLFAEGY